MRGTVSGGDGVLGNALSPGSLLPGLPPTRMGDQRNCTKDERPLRITLSKDKETRQNGHWQAYRNRYWTTQQDDYHETQNLGSV